MPQYDVLVRGAHPLPLIGIADGRIAAFEAATAREEIDATGLLVLPGVVDAHVHFNEPGRTEWEGWATGSRAAVAGGITTVCDMPLNSHPPVVIASAFMVKRDAAAAQSVCDFALWGGLVPGNVGELDALAACGVIGFKAFMCPSGIDDFPGVDLATLRAGMRRAAALGLPVAVHAELDGAAAAAIAASHGTETLVASPTESLAAQRAEMRATQGPHDSVAEAVSPVVRARSAADYRRSRPVELECAAIGAALDLAGETRCALHVVHVSSGRGVSLIAEARARGVDVTVETCPHYLVFTGDDMERLGAAAKCAPPLRDAAEREALLTHLRDGRVDTLGSDHSPAPWAMKVHDDFFCVWGGIAGLQHLLPLALDAGLDPDLVARLTARHVAGRFRLRAKGRLEPGHDADLTLVETGGSFVVAADSLHYRHRVSPYVGRTLGARVRRTLLRGNTVYCDGRITASRGGQHLVPS